MKIFTYGEDALTLWAIKEKITDILKKLEDSSKPEDCKAFFRPSFGRRGGDKSSQFGEFDFIILSEQHLYLGESKWDKSSEKILNGELELRGEQTLRHEIMKFYIKEWISGGYTDWSDFKANVKEIKLERNGIVIMKPIAPETSLLASNLNTVLDVIKKHYKKGMPEVKNVLLYLHCRAKKENLPIRAINKSDNFKFDIVVSIDYYEAKSPELGNLIRLQL